MNSLTTIRDLIYQERFSEAIRICHTLKDNITISRKYIKEHSLKLVFTYKNYLSTKGERLYIPDHHPLRFRPLRGDGGHFYTLARFWSVSDGGGYREYTEDHRPQEPPRGGWWPRTES